MGLLAPFFERRELPTGLYDDGGTTLRPANWLIDLVGGKKTTAGVDMTVPIAEGLPAIYSCQRVLSETVGQVPTKIVRVLKGGGKEADTEHPLYPILHDLWNPELTAYQGFEMVTRHVAGWGRGYAYIQRDRRGGVVGLWPLHPARMFVSRDHLNRKVFKYWMGRNDYQTWVHNPDRPDILHLHINSEDGLDGRSPLLINRESLGITKAAEDYVGAWFGNGAIPGIIATHPGKLSDKAKENIRRSWLDKFMGANKANKFAILEEGIAINVVGVDPDKSQLALLRTAQVEAAARIYRVPLFMIQNQTKDTSWGSGIEQQMLGFINVTMMPWFVLWSQAIARDLLTVKSFNTHQAVFVVNALVKGDIKTRFDAYATARQNGWLNADEIRELEDLNPIDGGAGQVYWMASGSQPILGNGVPAVIEPDPPTDQPAPPARMTLPASKKVM